MNGFNTAIGSNALFTNTTGSNNTAIGYGADVSSSNLTNATAIGYDAKFIVSNSIRLGNDAVTLVETAGAIKAGGGRFEVNTVGDIRFEWGMGDILDANTLEARSALFHSLWAGSAEVTEGLTATDITAQTITADVYSTSDARLKEKVRPLGLGLSLINDLKPLSYQRIKKTQPGIEMGLLAQEVKATLQNHGLAESRLVKQQEQIASLQRVVEGNFVATSD